MALVHYAASIPETLIDLLQQRASLQPSRWAYRFLDRDGEELEISYEQLDRRARAVAAQLKCPRGERILLHYPPGLDFIISFLGCLYAGAIAVPVFPARLSQQFPRLLAIINNAQATTVLTTAQTHSRLPDL